MVAFIRDINQDAVSGPNAAYFRIAWCPDRLTSRVPFCCEQRESEAESSYRLAATIALSSCYVRDSGYANDRVSRAINEARGDASLSLIVPSRVSSEHTNFLRPDRRRGSTRGQHARVRRNLFDGWRIKYNFSLSFSLSALNNYNEQAKQAVNAVCGLLSPDYKYTNFPLTRHENNTTVWRRRICLPSKHNLREVRKK